MAFLTGYSYRKSITLSRASGAVSNYQMKLLVGESSGATGEDVDCGGHCLSSFNDIRFTKSDGTTLLDYWIESVSGTTPNQLATIWIEFDYIGTSSTTFYMYYGNASAAAYSNGTNTFAFFDHFDSGSEPNTDNWHHWYDNGSETVSESIFTITGHASNNGWGCKQQYGTGYSFRMRTKIPGDGSIGTDNGVGLDDRSATGTYIGTGFDQARLNCGAGKNWTTSREGTNTSPVRTDVITNYSIVDIARNATTNVKYSINDSLKHTSSSTVPLDNMGFLFYSDHASQLIYIDWVAVRKYQETEPAWGTWSGAEQVTPGAISKIMGVPWENISKIYGISKSSIIKVGPVNIILAEGPDVLTGGTAISISNYNSANDADNACDDSYATLWHSGGEGTFPLWWKYDLGVGVTKIVRLVKIAGNFDFNGWPIKDFKIQGSNNDSTWDDLLTSQYRGGGSGQTNPQIWYFTNSTAYRYYRVYITSTWRSTGTHTNIVEISMHETPFRSYATWNPNDKSTSITLSNNNLTAVGSGAAWYSVRTTISKTSGKYYCEMIPSASNNGEYCILGIAGLDASLATYVGNDNYSWGWWGKTGGSRYYHNGGETITSIGFTNDDVIMIALDIDNDKIWFGKNGTWNGSPAGDPTNGLYPAYSDLDLSAYYFAAAFQSNGGVTANFGKTTFVYTPPSGFLPFYGLPSWFTSYTQSSNWIYGTNSVSMNFRMIYSASDLTMSGSKVRLTIKAHNTQNQILSGVSIGERSGSTIGMVSSPTRVTFDGGSSSVTVLANTDKVSDEIDFEIDETKQYLIHVFQNEGSSGEYAYAYTGGRYFVASGTDDTMTQTPTGYNTSQIVGYTGYISKIEVYT